MSELTEQIEALVKQEVEVQTVKYKTALQEAIGILQALVGEPQFECDECGDKFVPVKKIVNTRHAYCSEECYETASRPKPPAPEVEQKVHPRLSYKPEDEIRRSESQQLRRAREAATPTALRDCLQCGKPTSKRVYCSDDCRKKYEKSMKDAVEQSTKVKTTFLPGFEKSPEEVESLRPLPTCEVCGQPVENPNDFVCSDKCSRKYFNMN